jgi:hypothetical protein
MLMCIDGGWCIEVAIGYMCGMAGCGPALSSTCCVWMFMYMQQ